MIARPAQVIPVEDDDELASIQQEIDFLAACDHPNVVRYLVPPRRRSWSNSVWPCICINIGHSDGT